MYKIKYRFSVLVVLLCCFAIPFLSAQDVSISRFYYPTYKFEKIMEGGEYFQLNDGSVWKTGWWWQSKAKKWSKSDDITVMFDREAKIYYFYFKNETRNEEIWANLHSEPDAFNDSTMRIVEIEKKSLIHLNNGLSYRVNSRALDLLKWTEGDIITVLIADRLPSPFALYNHTKNTVICEAHPPFVEVGIQSY
jgi:hypothetical protein